MPALGLSMLLGITGGLLTLALPWAYPAPRAAGWITAGLLFCWSGRVLCRRSAGRRRWLAERPVSGFNAAAMAIAFAAAYGWGCWQVEQVMAQRLPNCADATARSFTMTVLDDPRRLNVAAGLAADGLHTRQVSRFVAEIRLPEDSECPGLSRHRVRLSWYAPPELSAGQHWQVEGKLRPSWGYRNPGGFDYERWQLGQRLAGTGYVRSGRLLTPGSAAPGASASVRAALDARIAADLAHRPLILALMMGDDSAIDARRWQVLRDSGTVHLLVVSGLHVGMVAGLLYQLGRALVRTCPWVLLEVGSRRAAALLGLAGSGGYVWVSGAGVPAVRAWLMSAAVLGMLGAGRLVGASRLVLLVLAVVLLSNPLVVHQQGFWLSFAAVFSLVAFFERRQGGARRGTAGGRPAAWVRQLMLVQLVLFVCLSPLLAVEQASVPLVGPLVNALAVPMVTLLVLPLVLAAGALLLVVPDGAGLMLSGADILLRWLMNGLELGAAADPVAFGLAGVGEWLLLALTVLLLGSAPGWRAGVLLAMFWWALLLPDQGPPVHGAFRVTALDVGQGTAVILETHRHRLLYDAGAIYPSGLDLGQAVVLPSLQAARRGRLDALILSHDDVDHTGGAGRVLQVLRPERIWSSFPAAELVPSREARRCRQGDTWRWDGVTFRFLHPPDGWRGSDNDGSCVLLIESGERRALIAGDVSARIERRLPKAKVDLAFAPHHGSRSSSSLSFVRGFDPCIVFVSTDRRSRYGHPHPEVVARYDAAQVFVTGRQGFLRWQSDHATRVQNGRAEKRAYWTGVWPTPEPLALTGPGGAGGGCRAG